MTAPTIPLPPETVGAGPFTLDQAAEALAMTAHSLWSAAMRGRGPDLHMFQWMNHPEPGQLVFVWCARGRPMELVGTYAGGWTFLGEPHEEETTGPRGYEVFMLEHLDGTWTKWSNVHLVRIPRDASEYRQAAGYDR